MLDRRLDRRSTGRRASERTPVRCVRPMPVRVVRIAFLGFGTVNRALHALLARRRDALVQEHAIECVVTGVASRRLGWRAGTGLDPLAPAGVECTGVGEWL